MLEAVIVDDEIHVMNLLEMFLQKTGKVKVTGTFTKPYEALKNIVNIKPDVVFLDIEMPEINGLELANQLIEQNDELMIVFVTGYNQYALEAFQVNALDYLLKPVSLNTIEKCVSRLIKLKNPKNENEDRKSPAKACCFGDFKVYGNNGAVRWPTRKVEELLAYFIIHRNYDIEGWAVGEILWPGEEPDKIKANLYTSIFRLRKTIKENSLPIEINSGRGGAGTYRLSLKGLGCDLNEFENSALKNTEIDNSNIHEYEQICRLYSDDLFMGKDYIWCEDKKEYLRLRYLNILKNMVSFYIKEGSYQNALDKLIIISRKSPFDEENHRKILKIYAHQKNRALLIKTHEEFKQKLLNEIGVEPQKETCRLFADIMADL